jgi:hypothetical protein
MPLDAADHAKPGARHHRLKTVCDSMGGCRRDSLKNDVGRWTWCPDCLTVYDDYQKVVNPIPEGDASRVPQARCLQL